MLYIFISHFNWYRNYYMSGNGARTLMDLQTRFPWGVTFHQKSLERAGVMERFRTFLRLRMLHFQKSVDQQQHSLQDLHRSLVALQRVAMVTETLPNKRLAAIDSNRVNSPNILLQPWKAPECKTSKRLVFPTKMLISIDYITYILNIKLP